ncbi:GyrI-like domain-containing protein [Dermatobacter hominis]|uniref:GyrI-like domain-containing protein n=1 Tax=Dermatobacter hominis TaxID=2884263 RepID=UPI001D104015|nr:GyrI-like domain-containing protein [Dermatobacter hominis]UDY35223.1 GyrI-like domain-containing protein [Dermatobacter hominis]
MSTTEPEIVEQAEQITMVIKRVSPMAELASVFDTAFPALAGVLADQQVQPLSPAFALYHGEPTDTADLEVGFITGAPIEPVGEVVVSTLPGGRVARTVHAGGYDGLGEAWGSLLAWIAGQGLAASGELWEVYLTEPTPEGDPADNRTELNAQLA